MGATFDMRERGRPARVDREGADGIGLARVLGAVLAPGPGRADAADEIERGVERLGQVDSDLAVTDAEGIIVVVHGFSGACAIRCHARSDPAMTAWAGCPLRSCNLRLKA